MSPSQKSPRATMLVSLVDSLHEARLTIEVQEDVIVSLLAQLETAVTEAEAWAARSLKAEAEFAALRAGDP